MVSSMGLSAVNATLSGVNTTTLSLTQIHMIKESRFNVLLIIRALNNRISAK